MRSRDALKPGLLTEQHVADTEGVLSVIVFQIQVQAVGRKDGELPCTISLPSIRMGLAAEGDKAAALEQWGSLAALKPELFVNAHLRNPGTPASNADTPKAASSPPLPSGVEDEAPALDAKERVPVPVVAAVKDADSTVKDVPTRGEPMQTPVEFEAVAAHFAAVMASESSYAVQVDRSTELTCREEAERRESEDRDAARKRKAEEMGLGELGEDELLAAEILSGSFLTGITHQRMPSPRAASGGKGRGSGGNRDENRVAGGAREGKRARQASAKAAAAALLDMPLRGGKGVGSRSRAGTGPKSVQGNKSSLPKGSANCAVVTKGKLSGAGKGAPGASGLDESAGMSAAWVKKVVGFLESNGQDLLSSICAHYRIDFCGDVSSIRDYSLEQLAHNAIFNPALPKASGRLPKMLRDIPGVTNWSVYECGDLCGFKPVDIAKYCSTAQCVTVIDWPTQGLKNICKARRMCESDCSAVCCVSVFSAGT